MSNVLLNYEPQGPKSFIVAFRMVTKKVKPYLYRQLMAAIKPWSTLRTQMEAMRKGFGVSDGRVWG